MLVYFVRQLFIVNYIYHTIMKLLSSLCKINLNQFSDA